MALISIAHPDFRPALLQHAISTRYVSKELSYVEDRLKAGPPELRTTLVLEDGSQVSFRPVHPTDEPRMRDLFYTLSQETLYYRFMARMKTIPRKQIQDFTYIDHRNEVAIVGTIPEAHGEQIIAIGRYYLDKTTNRAEVAFVVADGWQGRGIGTALYRHLANIARRNGIAGFTAEVLVDNVRMQNVFNNSGHNVRTRRVEGVYHYDLDFE
jgi:GNAT superfamily N-acetyltransferase